MTVIAHLRLLRPNCAVACCRVCSCHGGRLVHRALLTNHGRLRFHPLQSPGLRWSAVLPVPVGATSLSLARVGDCPSRALGLLRGQTWRLRWPEVGRLSSCSNVAVFSYAGGWVVLASVVGGSHCGLGFRLCSYLRSWFLVGPFLEKGGGCVPPRLPFRPTRLGWVGVNYGGTQRHFYSVASFIPFLTRGLITVYSFENRECSAQPGSDILCTSVAVRLTIEGGGGWRRRAPGRTRPPILG